ncbi:Asp-tRNA(Asn)/Glu-tRNA(Gln) amidotransferase subunit GatA [Candidatus Nomurabacteria bacterium]|nr:Asp-tRNA(Asn)/Glu-tRNA(Gln) amidotransferase subunit GatA [Candidatus Nomurabacteria bacterium]
MLREELTKLNIVEINRALQNKQFSVKEITESYLQAIDHSNLNAFISVNKQALKMAEELDQNIGEAKNNVLYGIPLAVKDIILVKDLKATAASQMLKNYIAPYTATVVERLEKEGMLVIGKTNCDEFAMGASNEHSAFGPVLNPHDQTRVSGGSSGGSAVAVAASLAPAALGSDTGGSIRQPAAFCGIVGLKPSYGRISRFGSIAMASSLDQIGPMAKSVEDVAYLLKAMAGVDKKDATSSHKAVPNYPKLIKESDPRQLVIGVPKEYFSDQIDPEIKKAIEEKIKFLENNDFQIKEVSLPSAKYALAVYYLLMPAEVSSNLARFDGLLYGLADQENLALDDWYKTVRSGGFSAEVKRRIMLGTYILSAGYYDAYYKQAQKVRTLIKEDFKKVFADVDVLLTPVTPTPAFKLGEKLDDPLQMYLADIFTVGANVAGICGLSLPIAKTKNNLPIGLQLLANSFEEEKILSLGYFLENNQ